MVRVLSIVTLVCLVTTVNGADKPIPLTPQDNQTSLRDTGADVPSVLPSLPAQPPMQPLAPAPLTPQDNQTSLRDTDADAPSSLPSQPPAPAEPVADQIPSPANTQTPPPSDPAPTKHRFDFTKIMSNVDSLVSILYHVVGFVKPHH